MKCELCEYYKPIGGVGFCRRFPPTQDGAGTTTIDEFPVVKRDFWCGEFKKKKGS